MVTTPGSIYFLRERDYQTGQISPYVKIGLVRNEKQTSTRIAEHQTGNPREIIDYHSLWVPFVEDLETRLHYLYGHRWVSGEWFLMTDNDLKEAITVAKAYIQRQKKMISILTEVKEFAEQVSNGTMSKPTRKAIQLFNAYSQLKSEQLVNQANMQVKESLLKNAMGSSYGIEGIISVQMKNGNPTFDKARFLEEDPAHQAIFNRYSDLKKPDGVKASWAIHHTLKLKNINSELYLQVQQSRFETDLKRLKKKPAKRSLEMEEAHRDLILLRAHNSRLDWDLFEIENQLKVLTNHFDGIEGICSWKRVTKTEKMEFNLTAFKTENPALYERFLTPGGVSLALIISPNRAYPIQF